jgi:hypothetical protein
MTGSTIFGIVVGWLLIIALVGRAARRERILRNTDWLLRSERDRRQ